MSKVIDSMWVHPYGREIIGLVILKKDDGEVTIRVAQVRNPSTEENDAQAVAREGGKIIVENLERFVERAKKAQKK